MRPDKKKNRHHDSVKSKKAALAKEKAGQKEDTPPPTKGVKTEEKEDSTAEADPSPAVQPSAKSFKGVRETGEKLIEEANQRYLAAQSQEVPEDPKYAKRNITSNWTKFELPSEDESEEDAADQNLTGEDYNYVLSTAR